MRARSESIEAIMRREADNAPGFVVRIEDTRLLKYAIFGKLVGAASYLGDQEKPWTGCLLDDLRRFGKTVDLRANRFLAK